MLIHVAFLLLLSLVMVPIEAGAREFTAAGSIDFIPSAASAARSNIDAQRPSHLDMQIAALHNRLDTLTKAIAEKNSEPPKIIIKTEAARPTRSASSAGAAEPVRPARPKSSVKPYMMKPHGPRNGPRMRRNFHDPLQHHPVQLHSVGDMLRQPAAHANHPLVDPNPGAMRPPMPPPHAMMPGVIPRTNMRKNMRRPKINMQAVVGLIDNIRQKVCPVNPGGEFKVTLGPHPQTGNLAVVNSENGFVVNIKCGNNEQLVVKPHKKVVKPVKEHKILLHRKSKHSWHSGKKAGKHSSATHNHQPKPQHSEPVRTPAQAEHHGEPEHTIGSEPHRVLIHRDHGLDLGLPDTINPPKPLKRP